MAKIYKITNMINGKSYIGKTGGEIKKRFKDHEYESQQPRSKNRPLYRAIRKYGIQNFEIELIEETSEPEKQEKYYIRKYNTYGKTGYNATLGGDGKSWLDHKAIVECYEKEQNIQRVSEIINCHYDSVYRVLKDNDINIKSGSDVMKETKSKPVKQYDLNDNYLQTFPSLTEAASWIISNDYSKSQDNKGTSSKISLCCKSKRKTAFKHKWEFLNKKDMAS